MGLGAGAIDFELGFGQVLGTGGCEQGFDESAAAETPGGSANFVEDGVFEDADRG